MSHFDYFICQHFKISPICIGGFISVIVSIIFACFLVRPLTDSTSSDLNVVNDQVLSNLPKRCNLIIGIISARDHFQQRKAIRETWLPKKRRENTDYCIASYFIVGVNPCIIPPLDRSNPYKCQYWNISEYGLEEEEDKLRFTSSVLIKKTVILTSLKVGIGFKVLHPIVISKLGVLHSLMLRYETLTILLLATATQEEVCKVQFSFQKTGTLVSGYVYRPINPLVLPKDFEGTVILSEALSTIHSMQTASEVEFDNGRGILEFQQVIDKTGLQHPFLSNEVVAVSAGFRIHDRKSLDGHVQQQNERKKNWETYLEEEKSALQNEVLNHQDVILVNTTDVYQYLPSKILAFYEDVIQTFDFDFLLKTDDDSIVDVDTLVKLLQSEYSDQVPNRIWWGRFRYNWLVERYGKWQELTYQSVVYPPFACGVAHVLSSDIVQWLAKNSKDLYRYQGEDVSLGIWLSAIVPTYVQDERWQCDESCHPEAISRGQLSPAILRESWKALQQCQNICACS